MNDLYSYKLYPETEATIKKLEEVNEILGGENLLYFYDWKNKLEINRMTWSPDTYWKSTGLMMWCWIFIIYPMVMMALQGLFG